MLMTVEIVDSEKMFSLSEAQELLPLVQKITHAHCSKLEPIQIRLDRMLSNDPRRSSVEREYQAEVSAWRGKVRRLGLKAAGLWVVEYSVGVDGRLSWRYPELDIAYFSVQGDSKRIRLVDYIEENDPDWALS